MTYIPIIPPTPTPPSPRARELADRLAKVLLEYEEAHPSVSGDEVRQAMRIALQVTRAGGTAAAPILAATLGGLVLVGLAVFYFVASGGAGSTGARVPTLWVVGALLVLAALVGVLRRRP